jgi:hypothetical protein
VGSHPRTFLDCPHVSAESIAEDRKYLRDSVFRIKHSCEWLADEGDSIISLEHVRALQAAQKQGKRQAADGDNVTIKNPPQHPPGALNESGIPYSDLATYNRLFVDPIRRIATLTMSPAPSIPASSPAPSIRMVAAPAQSAPPPSATFPTAGKRVRPGTLRR